MAGQQFNGFEEEKVYFVTVVHRVQADDEAQAKQMVKQGVGEVLSVDVDEEVCDD